MRRFSTPGVALIGAIIVSQYALSGAPPPRSPPAAEAPRRPIQPKPLSDAVKKGLAWLAETQLANGGWGQGEESVPLAGGDSGRAASPILDQRDGTG